jgi:hypothetical protein
MEALGAIGEEKTQPYEVELDDEVRAYYTDARHLPDGRCIGTMRLLFHWTIHVDIDPQGFWSHRYCFATYELAKRAFDEWDGTGDPDYWHRHPASGRRRDPATGRVWMDT